MNRVAIRLLNGARRCAFGAHRLGRRVMGDAAQAHPADGDSPPADGPVCDLQGQAASDVIRTHLVGAVPCMVSRIGHSELRALVRYRASRRSTLVNAVRYITLREGVFWWDDVLRKEMRTGPGFFPCDDAHLERFCEHFLQSMESIDVLGTWLPDEQLFADRLRHATRVSLAELEPFHHADPWTTALEGRKVLVVHPFETSIRAQYEKRRLLFADPRMLPDFELETLRAVQSIAGNTGGFASWFEALEWMQTRIREIDFDIALIGAGGYGLPLAAFVKRLGKKAVHLGGALQLMFGIKGNRWIPIPFYQKLFNEHWTRPALEETPKGYQTVEQNNTYW